VNGYLDNIDVKDVARFEEDFLRFVREEHGDLLETIRKEKALSDASDEKLKSISDSFSKSFG